jgi:hypothetical protein
MAQWRDLEHFASMKCSRDSRSDSGQETRKQLEKIQRQRKIYNFPLTTTEEGKNRIDPIANRTFD